MKLEEVEDVVAKTIVDRWRCQGEGSVDLAGWR